MAIIIYALIRRISSQGGIRVRKKKNVSELLRTVDILTCTYFHVNFIQYLPKPFKQV